jgi:hypothetical protein
MWILNTNLSASSGDGPAKAAYFLTFVTEAQRLSLTGAFLEPLAKG